MAEHGIRDFLIAKRKAAERMGVSDVAAVLPRNVEIEEALAEYQRLFGGESHVESLHSQRRAALNAMLYLREFEPRLVGAVLSGTATEHSDVQLHLFADRAESVRSDAVGVRAEPPVSAWCWPAIAAIAAPALLLAIVAAL